MSLPTVQVVTNEQDLLRLRPAWDDLYARAHQPFVSQSFEWVWCVWKNLMHEGPLRCIFIWQDGRLVLVWPAAIVRYHCFWTAEVPLATAGDYIDFLAEMSPESATYAQLAWQNRSRKADFTLISRVRVCSLLHQVLAREEAKPVQHLPARYVDWRQFTDWNAYYRNLSERRSIERRRRRLLEVGNVSFKATDDINEVQALSRWMLHHKQIWLTARGGQSPWVGSKRYQKFLQSIPEELNKSGHMVAFLLLLDDKRVAVTMGVVGTSRLILLHNADDQEFRQFSPQHLLTIRVLEWACERGLIVDFCFGAEGYKVGFAPSNCPVQDYRFPNSKFGELHEFLMSQKSAQKAIRLRRFVRQPSIVRE